MHYFGDSKIAITGGAGFIGSHLVDMLFENGVKKVSVVDTFFLGKEENIADAKSKYGNKLSVYKEDASDYPAMQEICAREEPDTVYNLATKALLYSFFNPSGACKVNLDIALCLAELLRKGFYGRLVHVSSSEVYGTAKEVPMNEDHPLLAETSYAAGKAAADLALNSYVNMFDLDLFTIRPFNNYGPRQNEGALAAVVPLTIQRILKGEKPVVLGDGRQTRDFIFVKDTVRAILELSTKHSVRGQTINIGSGEETSIAAIMRVICEQLGYKGEILYQEGRKADVKRHCAGIGQATALMGSVAITGIEEGIRQTVDWYKSKSRK